MLLSAWQAYALQTIFNPMQNSGAVVRVFWGEYAFKGIYANLSLF